MQHPGSNGSMGALSLPPGEVHLWFASPGRIVEGATLERYLAVLSPGERTLHRKFHFEADRRLYGISHGLLRRVLSLYRDVPPEAWDFGHNSHGKPEVTAPHAHSGLRFNLSHTRGLVAIVVAEEVEVGVDVEHAAHRSIPPDSVPRYLSPSEIRELASLPPAERGAAFYEYWTLKEAYIKARGLGLSLPLPAFSFHLEKRGPPRITFSPELPDDPGRWQFARFSPTAVHRGALAICRPRDHDFTIVTREAIPGPHLTWITTST